MTLLSKNQITDEDLTENRAGRLSPNQRRILHRGFVLILPVIVLGSLCGGLTVPVLKPSISPEIGLILFSVIFAGAVIYATKPIAIVRDLRAGRVSSISGIPQSEKIYGLSRAPRYYLSIRGERLLSTAELNQELGSGAQYRVYFLPHTRWMASWERLTD